MTANTSSVSPKGQVTIPRHMREAMGLATRDRVMFRLIDGVLTVVRAPSLSSLKGSIPPLEPPLSDEEIEEIVREERAMNTYLEGMPDE